MNTFITMIGGALFLAGVISFSIYKATDPHTLEAKEVRGMLEESENFANEVPQVMLSFSQGNIPADFYKVHIDQIADEVISVENELSSKEFDTALPVEKQQTVTLVRQLEDEIEDNKDATSSVPAAEFHALSEKLRTLKESI